MSLIPEHRSLIPYTTNERPLPLCRDLGTSALHDGNSRNQVFNFIHLGPERFSDFDVIYSGRQIA